MRKRQVDRERVARLYRTGRSVKEVAEEIGCAELTVKKVLWDLGIPIRSDVDVGKILALARAGWKPETIAWDMHLTEAEVADVLSRHREGQKA